MIAAQSGRDHTQRMERWARAHVEELARLRLCGFVLKSGSPSCGLSRVRIHRVRGAPVPDGRGLFADAAACRRFLDRAAAYERRTPSPVSASSSSEPGDVPHFITFSAFQAATQEPGEGEMNRRASPRRTG
jgi:hypothetical protein